MSSRPRRSAPKKPALSQAMRDSFMTLLEGNEAVVANMLSKEAVMDTTSLVSELESVMQVNSLSVEMLLARFFDTQVLGNYCVSHLGKSGKGSAAVLAGRISAAWERAQSNPKPKRSKKAPAPEDDWRTTLFVWQGELVPQADKILDGKRASYVWEGAWLGAGSAEEASQYQAKDFKQSPNKFKLDVTTTRSIIHSDMSPEGASKETETGWTTIPDMGGEFEGWYLLDNGAGHEKFRDKEHRFGVFRFLAGDDEPQDRGKVHLWAAAVGDTEFGRFVSLGRVDTTREPHVMTLCRRYVADSDKRAKIMTPDSMVASLSLEEASHTVSAPWKLL